MPLPIFQKHSVPVVLAPMAGVTDAVFRRICAEHGCDFTYTEMVSAKGLFYGGRKTRSLISVTPAEKPCAIQLFGSEPDIISRMVKELYEGFGSDISMIDVNMGCPMPKIVNNGEGSALMKDPDLCGRIVEACVRAQDRPVTVKIRAGFSENSRNAVEVARAEADR